MKKPTLTELQKAQGLGHKAVGAYNYFKSRLPARWRKEIAEGQVAMEKIRKYLSSEENPPCNCSCGKGRCERG